MVLHVAPLPILLLLVTLIVLFVVPRRACLIHELWRPIKKACHVASTPLFKHPCIEVRRREASMSEISKISGVVAMMVMVVLMAPLYEICWPFHSRISSIIGCLKVDCTGLSIFISFINIVFVSIIAILAIR